MKTTDHVAHLLLFGLSFVAPSPSWGQIDTPASHPASVTELLRYEPTGLSLLSPYARGKIPVVFIHGLWSNPASWHRMIAALEERPSDQGAVSSSGRSATRRATRSLTRPTC